MDNATFQKSLQKLQAQNLDMFYQPGARAYELCMGNFPLQVVGIAVANFRENGLSTVRMGEPEVVVSEEQNSSCLKIPLFVSVVQFIELDVAAFDELM